MILEAALSLIYCYLYALIYVSLVYIDTWTGFDVVVCVSVECWGIFGLVIFDPALQKDLRLVYNRPPA